METAIGRDELKEYGIDPDAVEKTFNGRRIICGWRITQWAQDKHGNVSECLKPHVYGDPSAPRVLTSIEIIFQTTDDQLPFDQK